MIPNNCITSPYCVRFLRHWRALAVQPGRLFRPGATNVRNMLCETVSISSVEMLCDV